MKTKYMTEILGDFRVLSHTGTLSITRTGIIHTVGGVDREIFHSSGGWADVARRFADWVRESENSPLLIPGGIEYRGGSCDSCGERPAEVGYICKGATGRWCVVFAECSECAPHKPVSADYARTIIEILRDGYADF